MKVIRARMPYGSTKGILYRPSVNKVHLPFISYSIRMVTFGATNLRNHD